MKQCLFFLLLFLTKVSLGQTTIITNYTDEKLPGELVTAIKTITIDNFENFSKRGTEKKELNGVNLKLKYKVKFTDGIITGNLNVSGDGKTVSYDIELPFQYCCSNHNPGHCTKKSEEVKAFQEKYKCSAWKKAKVDE